MEKSLSKKFRFICVGNANRASGTNRDLRVRELKLARLGILNDNKAVKAYLPNSPIKNTSKKKVFYIYTTFLDFKGLKWNAPKYQKTIKM